MGLRAFHLGDGSFSNKHGHEHNRSLEQEKIGGESLGWRYVEKEIVF